MTDDRKPEAWKDDRTEALSPATVGTLDAIHLATAVRLAEADKLDALMTYDKRLATATREHGIKVLSPS